MRYLTVFALLAMALPAHAGPGDPGPGLQITGYGETLARRELGVRDAVPPADQDVVRNLEGVAVIERTSRIEARLCRRFGILFKADNLRPGEAAPITIRSDHPALRRPDGRVSTGFSYESTMTAGNPGYSGFTFDHPWELVPGTWTFQVLYRGRVEIEQRFEVSLPPDGGQPVAGACGAAVS